MIRRSFFALAIVAGSAIVGGDELLAQGRLIWTVAPEPSLSIGTVDGAPEYMLVNVLMASELAPDGTQLAEVTVPPTAIPPCARRAAFGCSHLSGVFEVGDDYLLLPRSDDLGVRYLRRYPIQKSGGAP